MANALFDFGREGFLDGSIDWDTHNIKVSLNDSAVYASVNLTTDEFRNIMASHVALSANLSGKTVAAGVADASDFTFTAVTGAVSEYLDIYRDVGSSATDRLICHIDTATGLPVTPNSGDITVAWANTANKIFKL